MKRLLMAEQWDQFARAVLPIDASANQKREMRRAFLRGRPGHLLRGDAAAVAGC